MELRDGFPRDAPITCVAVLMRWVMRHAALLTVLWPTLLRAQPKPRVLFDVDTSGSMAWEACDPGGTDVDHTADCPGMDVTCSQCNATGCGNGLPDDGRLWKVKTAITTIVAAYGEVQFALARFHSDPVTFACKGGGWNGPSALCLGAPLGEGDNASDILVEFDDDNQRDLLEWVDFDDNYVGTPPAAGCNLCADCGGGCDKEMRPTGATPVAGSIFSCGQYLRDMRAMDSPSPCRPYALIVLSDGQNNCLDPDDISDPDPSPEQAAAVCADGIPVHVIGFAAPTLEQTLDEIADAGCDPPCEDPDMDGVPNCSNEAILVDDEIDLALACSDIIQAMIPFETCNGQDDDCDGATDEDFVTLGTPCDNGSCAGTICCDSSGAGTTCCAPAPSCEMCNGQDDDCDGTRDNNIDGDCDGVVDFPPVICECFSEECNAIDDDCDCPGDTNGDGTTCGPGDLGVDEEPLVTSGFACGSDIGVCEAGLTCCLDGAPNCCGGVGQAPEVCDCLDNDCNGSTDNGGGLPCFTLGDGCDPATGVCKGVCRLGQHECADLDPGPGCTPGAGPCLGERGPENETCNCADDDCDGDTDEGATVCPGGGCCENCSCPSECDPELENPCPAGLMCRCGDPACGDGCYCRIDPCVGVVCGACETCDADAGGLCLPRCGSGTIVCETWQECRCDTCVDVSCTNPAESVCSKGEACDPSLHECVRTPQPDAGCVGEGCSADGARESVGISAGGAGGCGCGIAAAPTSTIPAWAVLLVLAVVLARRRGKKAHLVPY